MAFSAFQRFGHPRFTGRVPLAQRIYEAMRKALGPSYSQEFNGSRVQARLFAQAMGLANAALTLERARNSGIALKTTELLPELERIYQLTPAPNDSLWTRRRALDARMQVSRGSREEAVASILRNLLGDDFLEWVTVTADTLARFPDTSAEAVGVGNYVPPGTQARILRTLEIIWPGTRTIAVEEITPVVTTPERVRAVDTDAIQKQRAATKGKATSADRAVAQNAAQTGSVAVSQAAVLQAINFAPAVAGLTMLLDPASIARRETIAIEDAVLDGDRRITSLTATFAKVHEPGVLLTSQYFPTWRSNVHRNAFRVSPDAASDLESRRKADVEMARTLRAVSTWDIQEYGAAFRVGSGLIGITPIGEDA